MHSYPLPIRSWLWRKSFLVGILIVWLPTHSTYSWR